MVYDQKQYDTMKSAYDRMTQEQRQQAVDTYKDNADFQSFAKDYAMGGYGKSTTSAPPTQPSNPQPAENNQQNQTSPNGQNWGNGGGNQQTSPQTAQTQTQPQTQPQGHQFGYQTDETYRKQRDTQFAQQLYQSNPNTFDYNAVFNYVKSQAPNVSSGEITNTVKNIQRQRLQHSRIGTIGTSSVEQIRNGLLNGQFSQSDLEVFKAQNPEKYQEYLAYDDKMNAMSNAKHNANLTNKLYNGESVKESRDNQELILEAMEKFFGTINYNSEEIVNAYKEAINSSEIQKRNSKMLETQREMDEIDDDLDTLRDDLKRQYPGISKTQLNALIYDRSYKSMKRKNELHRDYTQARGEVQFLVDLAGKNLEADLKGIELERAEFADKYNALGFAKGILEFETPQQKRDAELEQIKKKSELEAELSDINSKDPKIQFNAVMKALDQYYKDFGSIILRPQAQAAQDIINLAKKEGISVGEAMRKNFIEPLQKKDGYKMLMNKNYGISNEPKEPKIVNIGGTDYQYDPSTGEYRLPQLSDGTSFTDYQMKGRANRHNNPTAMTTDVAKSLGMVEGVDYVKGDSFRNGRYYTAKLLGNGVETTINAFDKTANDPKKRIFYTQGGKQRWTYLAMSDEEWLSLSQEEKIGIIQRMYNNEEQRDRRNFGAFGYSSSEKSNGNYNPTRSGLYNEYLTSNKTPSKDKLKQMGVDQNTFISQAEAYSQQTGYTPLTDTQFTQSNQVINSFKSDPQVKAFEEAYTNGLSLLSSLEDKSGPGDVAAIFSFMKSLDPKSVVRESEFEVAAKSSGVFAYIGNTYDRLMKGEKLTNQQRIAFGKLAKQFILDKSKNYDIKYQDGLRRLKMQGISESVFPSSIADEMRNILGVSKIYADIATSLKNEREVGVGTLTTLNSNSSLSYIVGN